jgi:hypothetical protein
VKNKTAGNSAIAGSKDLIRLALIPRFVKGNKPRNIDRVRVKAVCGKFTGVFRQENRPRVFIRRFFPSFNKEL